MIKAIKLDNGKEYRLFTSRMEVEVKTSRIHAETGYPIWMRVNGARVISQVISAIADADHTEALDMNAAIEWAKITPEQRAIHDARVTHGISLKNKYNTDDILEACHAEALEMNYRLDCTNHLQCRHMEAVNQEYVAIRNEAAAMNESFDASFARGAKNWGAMDWFSREVELGKAHAEALNMDAARALNARQARFVFHNTAAERAEAIEAAHAEALKMDASMKI